MKKIMCILIVILSLKIVGCSGSAEQLTNKEMVELFLKYVIETQQEAWIRAGIKATPTHRPLYHVLTADLIDRVDKRNQLWKQIEGIKELEEEAKEQKAREEKVFNGEDHRNVFYEPIDFDLT